MALYYELPVYRDVYKLILMIFECKKDFSKEYKYTLGQDIKRDDLQLVRNIYRGGASGAYTRLLILNPTVNYTYLIVIGGTARIDGTSGSDGGNGGQTSFNGTAITAPGGLGGKGSGLGNGNATAVRLGGNCGAARAGGNFSVAGYGGGTGFVVGGISIAGFGASSFFCDGPVADGVTGKAQIAGSSATGYGAGASGAAAYDTNTAALCADGYKGVIIITKYK